MKGMDNTHGKDFYGEEQVVLTFCLPRQERML